jgi:hypothetical protein
MAINPRLISVQLNTSRGTPRAKMRASVDADLERRVQDDALKEDPKQQREKSKD